MMTDKEFDQLEEAHDAYQYCVAGGGDCGVCAVCEWERKQEDLAEDKI